MLSTPDDGTAAGFPVIAGVWKDLPSLLGFLQHLSCAHTAQSHVLVVYCHLASASKHRHSELADVNMAQSEVCSFFGRKQV